MKSKNGKATFPKGMKGKTLEAMLKWTTKRLKQRKNKPLAKHGKETLANAGNAYVDCKPYNDALKGAEPASSAERPLEGTVMQQD